MTASVVNTWGRFDFFGCGIFQCRCIVDIQVMCIVLPPNVSHMRADAKRIASFVRANLWDEQRQRLLRSFLNGPSDVEGFADDYAYLISGLLDLYSACGETQWLAFAQQLQRTQDTLFWDDTAGMHPNICAEYGTST